MTLFQTGFSDAGRFMGQIPATLAIERLQSHFAAAMAKHGIKGVTSIATTSEEPVAMAKVIAKHVKENKDIF